MPKNAKWKENVSKRASNLKKEYRKKEQENNEQDEIDWQQYIEQVEQFGGYQDRRYSGKSDDEDNPSIEATTAKSESLVEYTHSC